MPFNALVFTLHSKLKLNWMRYIRPVIAQSVQFRKIAQKTEHRFVTIFCSSKGTTALIKIMK